MTPVEADDVGAGGGHGFKKTGGFDAEVDDGHAHLLDGADEAVEASKT